MFAAAHSHCAKSRAVMGDILKIVDAIAGVPLPHSSLHALIPLLIKLRPTLIEISGAFPPVSHAEDPLMQTAHAHLVIDFAAYLNKLVPQLDRLASTAATASPGSGTVEENVFWNLWMSLTCVCMGFGRWPVLWEYGRRQFHPPMFDAFYSLLKWLLKVTRCHAWLCMKREHGLLDRNHAMYLILSAPMQYVGELSITPLANVTASMSSLPPEFIPLLCCIASEHFGNVPSLVSGEALQGRLGAVYSNTLHLAYTDPRHEHIRSFYSNMSKTISSFVSRDSSIRKGMGIELPFLESPSVIQAMKVMLLFPGNLRSVRNDMMYCLQTVLFHNIPGHNTSLATSTSTSDNEANRDARGLPWHLNPLLSKRVLETDVRLLHALGIDHVSNGDTTSEVKDHEKSLETEIIMLRYRIQALVVKAWVHLGESHPATLEALKVMADCMVGIARRCTSDSLVLMQGAQGRKSPQQDCPKVVDSQQPRPRKHLQQKQKKQQLQKLRDKHAKKQEDNAWRVKLAEALLTALGKSGMNDLRWLMRHASDFNIPHPDGASRYNMGEVKPATSIDHGNMQLCLCFFQKRLQDTDFMVWRTFELQALRANSQAAWLMNPSSMCIVSGAICWHVYICLTQKCSMVCSKGLGTWNGAGANTQHCL